MDLRALSRFLKSSVVAIQSLSIVNITLWIAFFIWKGQSIAAARLACLNVTSTASSTESSNNGNTTENSVTPPIFCPDPPPFHTPENDFIFSYAMLISLIHLGDQMFLYCAIHYRKIRKLQVFTVLSIATGVINSILLIYLLICTKFWQAGLMSFSVIPRLTQIYFVIKFLHTLIASPPRASLDSTDSEAALVQPHLSHVDINS